MKRSFALLLALLLLTSGLGIIPTAFASTPPKKFTDVEYYTDWYAGAVDEVSWHLMVGDGDRFYPERTLTRAELALIASRFSPFVNLDEKNYTEDPFEDVDIKAWYGKAVYWAKEIGIMNGVGDNKFAPDETITREQLCTVLSRLAQYRGFPAESASISGFVDNSDVSDWAVDGVRHMVKSGVIKGMPGNLISPKTAVTRGEMAMIACRFSDVTIVK